MSNTEKYLKFEFESMKYHVNATPARYGNLIKLSALRKLETVQEVINLLKITIHKKKPNFFGINALHNAILCMKNMSLINCLYTVVKVANRAANYATHVAKEAKQAYDALKKRKSASDERLPFKKRRITTTTTTTNVVNLTQCD